MKIFRPRLIFDARQSVFVRYNGFKSNRFAHAIQRMRVIFCVAMQKISFFINLCGISAHLAPTFALIFKKKSDEFM